MAGASVETISQILKDYYIGGRRIEAVKVTVWSCPEHKHPVHDKYGRFCLAAEALGTECEDLSECPHVVERKFKDGCAVCKVSRYEDVLDYETVRMDETGFVYGDPVYKAKLFTDLEWELSQSVLLLGLDLSRTTYGDTPKVTIPLHMTKGGE
jgi:hypothetical protein